MLSRAAHAQARSAAGGFRVRRQRDSRARAEPRHEIPMGEAGAVREEGDAVPQRGAVHSGRGGREGDVVRRAKLDRVQEYGTVVGYVAADPKLVRRDFDAVVPLLLSCWRMRIADEIHIDEKSPNFSNLPEEVKVCQPIGRLIERTRPVGVRRCAQPRLGLRERRRDQRTRAALSKTASSVNLWHVALRFDEHTSAAIKPSECIPAWATLRPKLGKHRCKISRADHLQELSVSVLAIRFRFQGRHPPNFLWVDAV